MTEDKKHEGQKTDYVEWGLQKAMNTALRLLARRDHTCLEIQQKLKQRSFSNEVIDKVVSECERLDYLNDERTARIYIRQMARRGFGFRRIRLELKKKGLEGDGFEAIIKDSSSEIDEKEIAEKIIQKKMKHFKR